MNNYIVVTSPGMAIKGRKSFSGDFLGCSSSSSTSIANIGRRDAILVYF